MIVCSMLAVLSGAFTFVCFICLKSWSYQKQRLDLRESAIWAFEDLSRDLRQARLITLAQSSRVTFVVSTYEAIDYNLVLNAGIWQLIRTYTLSTTPASISTAAVSKNVSTFTLQFYDSNGVLIPAPVPAAQLVNIRLVMITLSNRSTLWTNTETVTFRTQIRPRNL